MTSQKRRGYEQSQFNWARLKGYAKRVARETTKPRENVTSIVQETRTREVRAGLLGLSRRQESYTVNTEKTQQADHWKLTNRHWVRTEKRRGYYEEVERATYYYCLGVDGSLFMLIMTTEEVYPENGRMTVNENSSRHAMSEEDALTLDFESKYHSFHERHSSVETSVETNREPDRSKLKYDTKGDGLSQSLKAILDS
jgi:hypothetical protein